MGSKLTPEEIAMRVMESESMLWLMCGGDEKWIHSHLDAIKPAWDAWIEAGGISWGKPRP